MNKKLIRRVGIVIGLAFLAAQLYRPERSNPAYDAAGTYVAMANPGADAAAILERACADCHSNDTVWPWYSNVAPFSWVIADDVRNGRRHLNFSEWSQLEPDRAHSHLLEVCEVAINEEMPLPGYLSLHPEAALSSDDVDVLCALPDAPLPDETAEATATDDN